MTSYAGLDVSLRSTHICIIDADGELLVEGKTDSGVADIIAFLEESEVRHKKTRISLGNSRLGLIEAPPDLALRSGTPERVHVNGVIALRSLYGTDANSNCNKMCPSRVPGALILRRSKREVHFSLNIKGKMVPIG